jgi:hypothetical protein
MTRRRIIEAVRVSAYLLAMCLIFLVVAMALLGCTPSVQSYCSGGGSRQAEDHCLAYYQLERYEPSSWHDPAPPMDPERARMRARAGV